ncbi:sigma factor [Nonomuraea sp. NPDC049152]|uniref:sigma factor n=1 Tax=Nonomuraea sp. NPDC049152 TaxID=3154350 RepID=UPI0033C39C5B
MDDEPGFDELVAEQADALLRYGYVLTGNPHDAADLVQEALVRLRRLAEGETQGQPAQLRPDHDGTVAHQRLAAAQA